MKKKSLLVQIVADIKKYNEYIIYAAKSDLKAEVANSYLNWLWWILDPLMFMCVYSFVSIVVFRATEPYFSIFVFVGLTAWNFFSKTLKQSVLIVRSNTAIVSKVYIPKYMLIMQKMLVNGFKMCVSWILVFLMVILWRVPPTFKIFYALPILVILILFTFGVSCIVAHFGVFIEDLSNIISILLNLIFYLSGIFYSVEKRIPTPFNYWALRLNPTSLIINELRKVLLYGQEPLWGYLCGCLIISILFCIIGIQTIYKYENSYVKVS